MQALAGSGALRHELYNERGGSPLLVKKQVVLTGDRLTDAQPGFDSQTSRTGMHLTLDCRRARIFGRHPRERVGKRMAILLIEKGKGRGGDGAGDPHRDRWRRVQISVA